jgi:hypothetical protein
MPRDSSGNYTLPAGNPVVTGTVISSAGWGNPTMSDIATVLTASLDRSGNGGMLAAFKAADGTVSAPGIAFANELTTGLYRAGAGTIGVTVLGAQRLSITSTAITTNNGVNVVIAVPTSGVGLTVNGVGSGAVAALDVETGGGAIEAIFNNTAVNGSFCVWRNSGTAIGYVGTGSQTITGAALGDFCIAGGVGAVLRLGTPNGAGTAISIATTGAVTVNAPSTAIPTFTINVQNATGTNTGSGVLVSAPNVANTSAEFKATMAGIDSILMGVEQATGPYLACGGQMQIRAGGFASAQNRVLIAAAGGVTINSATSGTGLTIFGPAANGSNVAVFATSVSASGQSFGFTIKAGTNTADFCQQWANFSGATIFGTLDGTGGLVLGAPTGGSQGLGTINTTGLYINGVALSVATGNFTASYVCGGATPTGTAQYRIANNICTIVWPAVVGAGAGAALTITGLPAACQPARTQYTPMGGDTILNNGVQPATSTYTMFFTASSGTVTIVPDSGAAAFAGAGNRGITNPFTSTHMLN